MAADRAAVELGLAVSDGADQPGQRRHERLHGRGARLGQRGGAVNPVVDHHQHTFPAASLFAATATALKKFSGPSAESAVAGRIAAVRTTGLRVLTTRLRK